MAYPNGQFTWTDVALPDVASGKEFYEELFGWQGENQYSPEGDLIYVMFSQGGETAAGMGPMPPEMQASGIPPMWQSYVTVDSVDDTLAKVVENGGNVIMEAMDVMDSGRMAMFADPTGAVLAIWQAGTHDGASKFNEHGLMAWNELMTRDTDVAKAFYAKVFGWSYRSSEMPGGNEYIMIYLGEQANGGLMQMGDLFPDAIPAHWMAYFRVDDTEEIVSQLKGLGGSLSVEPFDSPAGTIAVVADPQGGTFSVIGPPPEREA